MCSYKDSVFVYGGIGSQKFDHFNEYDMNEQRWFKFMPKNTNYTDLPAKRFGHTMCAFQDYFVLFGGCGNYSKKTKIHESFNDVKIFDLRSKEWEKLDYNFLSGAYKQYEPEKRMYHVAAV
jgi:hypothetical protein